MRYIINILFLGVIFIGGARFWNGVMAPNEGYLVVIAIGVLFVGDTLANLSRRICDRLDFTQQIVQKQHRDTWS